MYFRMVPSPSPAGNMRGLFSDFFVWGLVELLEVNLTISWVTPMTGSPWSFKTSELPILSLQESMNYSSDFSSLAQVPMDVSACESLLW